MCVRVCARKKKLKWYVNKHLICIDDELFGWRGETYLAEFMLAIVSMDRTVDAECQKWWEERRFGCHIACQHNLTSMKFEHNVESSNIPAYSFFSARRRFFYTILHYEFYFSGRSPANRGKRLIENKSMLFEPRNIFQLRVCCSTPMIIMQMAINVTRTNKRTKKAAAATPTPAHAHNFENEKCREEKKILLTRWKVVFIGIDCM